MHAPLKVLVLGSIWPEASASAASTRILTIVDHLLARGFQVTLSADAREGPATEALRAQGVTCVRLPPNDPSFRIFVADLKPDITIFDRFTTEEKFGWQVRETCPECLRILDTIDLHCLREARTRALTSVQEGDDWHKILRWSEAKAHREIAAIYRSDLSLVVSDYEMTLLTQRAGVPPSLLLLCRLTYPPPPPKPREFAQRSGFVMIGSFRHPPNVDSVQWTRQELWPAIRRRLPQAELHIYGAHAQAQHLALSQDSMGFRVMGQAPDALEVMAQKRVNLAPLRFGAGIKGKIADGWWSGTPVVTTPVGAEGMFEDLPFGGVIAETVDGLAQSALLLHEDEGAWHRASQAGLDIVTRLYSKEVTIAPLLERLTWLLDHKDDHRRANFTGAMLWQQGLRATEYFSRWIEAKNQPQPSQSALPRFGAKPEP